MTLAGSYRSFSMEEQSEKIDFEYPSKNDFYFYHLVKNGRTDEVKTFLEKRDFLKIAGKTALSENRIQNLRYHFVFSIAMLTRFCLEGGMPESQAYGLNYTYTREMDRCYIADQIMRLHCEACIEYAFRMQELRVCSSASIHVRRCVDYVHQNLRRKIYVHEIAELLHLYPSHLSKLFHEEMGCSLHQYILERKIDEAKNLLAFTDLSCTVIAESLAFSTQSYFVQTFQKYVHKTPREFRIEQAKRFTFKL